MPTADSVRTRGGGERAGDFARYHKASLSWSALLVVVAVWFFAFYTHPRSQTAVVHNFVHDLNNRSSSGLRSDVLFVGPNSLVEGNHSSVAQVIAKADLPWNVIGITIEGTTPTVSSAYVTGTAGGKPLTVYLPLRRQHGRWYIVLANPNDPQSSSSTG